MANCCGNTPSPLVVAKKGDKTCKISSAALKVFNAYFLNKQQDWKKDNTIDYTSSKLAKDLGKDAVRN